MTSILSVENLSKSYRSGDRQLMVLDHISFEIETASSCAIVGPSGSGKTTLLGLCAGLDLPTTGRVVLNGTTLDSLDEDGRARFRNRTLGFVFQNFQLMPTLTALENVMVPLELRGENNVYQRARDLLDEVGLSERHNHYPVQLSGGEQQRVALARAFINEPRVLFADEPTGNLDAETSDKVESLIFELNQARGATLIVATHDLELANRCDRIIKLRGGILVSDEHGNGARQTVTPSPAP